VRGDFGFRIANLEFKNENVDAGKEFWIANCGFINVINKVELRFIIEWNQIVRR